MDSVIFNTPLLVILYSFALLFAVIGLKRPLSAVLPFVSIVISLLTTGYAILLGATLFEVALVLLVFLAVNLTVFMQRGKK